MFQQHYEARIRELERRLTTVTRERDDLQKDVESLCLENGSSMFSSSYVLTERVKASDKEKEDLRTANDEMSLLNTALSDEVTSLKASNVALEARAEQLKKAKDKIEKDLAFYQSQLSKAISERDRAVFDAEQLTVQLSNAVSETKAVEVSNESLNAERAALDQQLMSAREEVAQLHDLIEVRDRENEEALRRLRQASEETIRLESALAAQQARADKLYSELEVARRALLSSQEIEGRLRVQLHETETIHASLQGSNIGQAEVISRQHDEISSLSAELLALKAASDRASLDHLETKKKLLDREEEVKGLEASLKDEVESSRSERRGLEQQIEALQARIAQQQQQHILTEAERAVVDASSVAGEGSSSMPESDSEAHQHSGVASDEKEQLEILTFLVHDLKIKLAQATQEKVEALMMVAAGENASRSLGQKSANNTGPINPSPSSVIGGGHVAAASSLLTSILNWTPSIAQTPPPPTIRPPSPMLPQSVSPSSPRDLHSNGGRREAELQMQIDEMSALARQFRAQLSQSSSVVWNASSTPTAKWQAIEKLAKIHKDLSRLKASAPSDPNSASNIQEVLGLAEVALLALERSSRQEAISSLGIGSSHPVSFE